MKISVEELYLTTVQQLSPEERLQLAVMILNDITPTDETIEYSDSWSDEDLQDLLAFTLSHSENPHEKNRTKP